MRLKSVVLFIYILISGCTISYAQHSPFKSDTLSLLLNEHHTIFVKAVFNGRDTLNLNFDTGTTDLILTENTIKNNLSQAPSLYNTAYELKMGNTTYKTKVNDAKLSGHGTHGRFGWDLFKNKVVEVDYDKGLMIVHGSLPKYVVKNKKYEPLKMEFWNEVFFVKSTIKQSGVANEELFLFYTGYNRTVILDNNLLLQGKFPTQDMDVIEENTLRGAQGNEIKVITSNLKTLKIGDYSLKDVPAQVLTSNKPLKGKNMHILGNEVLKRFNLFLDFQTHTVYLKPNRLYKDSYTEANKKA